MPRINVRTKGQTGEREIATRWNKIVDEVLQDLYAHNPYKSEEIPYPFQRNQNQSAVGGSDLSNPFGLSIEVKRQEQLSVNTWWKQCLKAASEEGAIPVLVYRQNRKPWKVIIDGFISFTNCPNHICRVEVSLEDFEVILRAKMKNYFKAIG
jgi:hypothetical protein